MRKKNRSVLVVGATDILQRCNEIIEDFSRHHDTVTVRAHLFGDTHNAATSVALEVDKEGLAVSNDFFGANDIVVHCYIPGVVIRNPYGHAL